MDSFEEDYYQFIELARNTDFENNPSNPFPEPEDKFNDLLDPDSDLGKKILLRLTTEQNRSFYEQTGWRILKWLLHENIDLFTSEIGPPIINPKKHIMHAAIDVQNNLFLDSVLTISDRDKLDITKLLSTTNDIQRACVSAAIGYALPSALVMVKMCSSETILCADKDGSTSLHIITSMQQKTWAPKLVFKPNYGIASLERTLPNTSKARATSYGDSATKEKGEFKNTPENQHSNEGDPFKPLEIYRQMKTQAQNMELPKKERFIIDLLTAIDKDGMSPYQSMVRRFDTPTSATSEETAFQTEMKNDIFDYLSSDVSLVRKALYGTGGIERELFLDMSDFSNPSQDFREFIKKLTGNLESPDTEETAKRKGDRQEARQVPEDSSFIKFEDILFYVCLPDLNNFKEPPHREVRKLFRWLKSRNVKVIKSLEIPDSTTHPMSDVLIEGAIFKEFMINKLVWRKLDINLDLLTSSEFAKKITDITLYSSGNWSVLYHWISEEGLMKLENLQKVTIVIVQLHPSNDEESHNRYKSLSMDYKGKVEMELRELRKSVRQDRPDFAYNVQIDYPWNFPITEYDQRSSKPFVPNLKLYEHLDSCHSFLKGLLRLDIVKAPPDQKVMLRRIQRRFKDFTMHKPGILSDKRIKVAIIDNGADGIRPPPKQKNCERILSWWTVSDPHGTQMASLIERANPFCRLYIARVGKGRGDILPDNAAKAIEWAIDQKVDVISISWVIKHNNQNLQRAIEKATATNDPNHRPILVFCSTADEGVYSGPVYPSKYPGTVSVAATDQYGHLRPTSDGRVRILVPGDNVSADGPLYMGKFITGSVSGSSVATASAAGIASLALLLLKTFNSCEEKEFRDFYTEDGIMRVFNKMQETGESTGIQLAGLFPNSPGQNVEHGKMLHDAWQLSEFPKINEGSK